jgi:hypothetical protein
VSSPTRASVRSSAGDGGADTANDAWTPVAASARAIPAIAPCGARTTSATSGRAVATCVVGRSSSGRATSE